MSAADALKQLARELAEKQADAVPDGWITREEYARLARMSMCNAGKILAAATKAGLIEMRMYRVATGRGVRNLEHYPRPE